MDIVNLEKGNKSFHNIPKYDSFISELNSILLIYIHSQYLISTLLLCFVAFFMGLLINMSKLNLFTSTIVIIAIELFSYFE